MKLKLLIGALTFLTFLNLPVTLVQAENSVFKSEQIMVVRAEEIDTRVLILRDYFAKYNSPLVDSAQDFVDAADTYGIDWRLVAAISGTESTFGQHTPGGFNCWGWGVYGDQALGFKSYKDAIFTISKGLRENYVNKGYTEPYSMNKIYASSPTWGAHTSYFINDIQKFADNYALRSNVNLAAVELPQTSTASSAANLPITAGLSSKLANAPHNFSLQFVQ